MQSINFTSNKKPALPAIEKVSIIIPARNEERNLSLLLDSLDCLKKKPLEIIVVDDRSSDLTAQIAIDAGAMLIAGKEKPYDWTGKQWACAQGAEIARGEYLLFLDADVRLYPDGLNKAMNFLMESNLDALSACPYHQNPQLWERLLGVFHLLVLLGTAPFAKPTSKRLFAIGQFMLFTRAAYDLVSGHQGVKDSLTEDIDLARKLVDKGLKYQVYMPTDIYQVRMFADFSSFIKGWRRLIRVGLPKSSFKASFEVFAVIFALIQFISIFSWYDAAIPSILILSIALYIQKSFGKFTVLGIPFFFISVFLFLYVSVTAFGEHVLGKPLVWRGRRYKTS